MRPSRSSLATIALGLGVLGISLVKVSDRSLTTLALFLAAVILVELVEESDRERSREPSQTERFRLASAVHIAALIVLGPWAGALVAAAGVAAAGLFRKTAFRGLVFDASAAAIAACAGGIAFGLAGGDVGSLVLLDDLIPVVALALAYLTTRALLLDVVRARENFDPRLVASFGEAGLGATLALLAIGHPWNVVVLIPVAIAVHQAQLRLRSLQRQTLRALETFANKSYAGTTTEVRMAYFRPTPLLLPPGRSARRTPARSTSRNNGRMRAASGACQARSPRSRQPTASLRRSFRTALP
jgi:hypothetical protein